MHLCQILDVVQSDDDAIFFVIEKELGPASWLDDDVPHLPPIVDTTAVLDDGPRDVDGVRDRPRNQMDRKFVDVGDAQHPAEVVQWGCYANVLYIYHQQQ